MTCTGGCNERNPWKERLRLTCDRLQPQPLVTKAYGTGAFLETECHFSLDQRRLRGPFAIVVLQLHLAYCSCNIPGLLITAAMRLLQTVPVDGPSYVLSVPGRHRTVFCRRVQSETAKNLVYQRVRLGSSEEYRKSVDSTLLRNPFLIPASNHKGRERRRRVSLML